MALLAMFLLVLAPNISRWMASKNNGLDSNWAELCTATGLKLVKLSDFGKGEMPKPMPMGPDCAYCPLAASIAPLLLLIALVFPRVAQRIVSTFGQTIVRVFLYPRGLGSRGPPLAL